MGTDARPSCTATGHAWLLTMSDERALELISRQGFGAPKDHGPKAQTTVQALR
jgi:IclR family transcriptional regulator, acetate operon repressor